MVLKKRVKDRFPWYALCSNFLDLVIPSLENMIEKGQTYANGFTFKKWNGVLKEMLKGFKIAKKVDDSVVSLDELSKRDRESLEKSFDLFKEHFWDLWD